MRLRNKFCVLLSIAMIPCVFTACGKKEDEKVQETKGKTVQLTLWGSADDQKMLEEMVEDFKKANPDKTYQITQNIVGENRAQEEVLKDPSAAADVYAIPNDQLGMLVDADVVYENTIYKDQVCNSAIDDAVTASTYKGKLYGYPASQKTCFLYYDKRIFNEEDVKSIDTMLAKEVPAGVSKLGIDMTDAYYTIGFFLTNGCQLFGPKGMDEDIVTFNNEQGLEAANYMAALKSKGVVSINKESPDTQFETGKLGAYISGDWKAVSFKEKLGENYGVAELPIIDMGSGPKHMKSFSGFNLYCVKAKTPFPEEAMALANFITNKENQIKRFKMRNLVPVNKQLVSDNAFKTDATVSAIFGQLEHCVPMPSIPRIGKFWAPTCAFSTDIFEGRIPSDKVQAKLDQLVSDIKP